MFWEVLVRLKQNYQIDQPICNNIESLILLNNEKNDVLPVDFSKNLFSNYYLKHTTKPNHILEPKNIYALENSHAFQFQPRTAILLG